MDTKTIVSQVAPFGPKTDQHGERTKSVRKLLWLAMILSLCPEVGFGQTAQEEIDSAGLPDLVVTSGSVAPVPGYAGEVVQIWLRVKNVGPTAAGGSWAHVLLSCDCVLGGDDSVWVSGIWVPTLNPGQWFDYTTTTQDLCLAGLHHVLMQCDVLNEVWESNEQNNVLHVGTLGVRLDYTFDLGTEGWQWFEMPKSTVVGPAAHVVEHGSLKMTESAGGGAEIVYGAWESPKDPVVAAHARWGSLVRVRYHMRSSVGGARCPGFRFRAHTVHAVYAGGQWVPDFLNQDFNSSMEVFYPTPNSSDLFVPGREPGIGRVYTLLYWPEMTPTLGMDNVVMYFTCDLADAAKSLWDDAGMLYLDQVEIDYLDCPPLGSGRAEPALSFTDFSSWTTSTQAIGASFNGAGLQVKTGPTSISITVAPANRWFEAAAYSNAVPLESGRYYRMVYRITSTATPGGDFGPTVRVGLPSSRFAFNANKELWGGGLWAAFYSTTTPFEIWVEAPSALSPTLGLTEPMQLRFESWLTENPIGFPWFKTVSGTVRCHEVFTESYPAF